ncbi:CRE-GLR-7 protein [Aphelenchoides besseyi]|nr:CRE-GLR-7 protein [Aphelenchoides besseyi]
MCRLSLKKSFATMNSKCTAIIHDGEDSVVFPLIQALNVSLVFYRDVYHIKQKLEMNVLQLDANSSILDENLMEKDTDFIISLTKDYELQQRLLQTAQNLNIPTIQTQLQPWDGSYKENDQITVTDNYAIMVPSYIVFDNLLYDYIKSMNITSETTVIYDEKYMNSMEYDWKSPYTNLSVPIDFQLAEKTSGSITAHLNKLEQAAKVLLFITDTKTVEDYVLAGQKQIEAGLWQWLVFTKDTLPFRCSKCNNAQLHWVRVVKSTSTEELSNFSDFVWSEELENQFLFSRNTYNHLQTSYCLDIVYTAIDYLLGENATSDSVPEGTTTPAPVEMDMNVTIKTLLERSKDYDFGPYEHHYAHWYYQVTNAIILRIDRMARFPDAKFSKHVTDQLLIGLFFNGITPFYDSLGVNVRQLTHYRIVTILQEPFIETGGSKETFGYQGYCIDLLEMIRQDLNFTYELYLVPDGKFGATERTGNWNGMIGQLVSGEADIALGPISVIAERESDIDFTVSFYDLVGTTILMKRTEVEYSLFKFLMAKWPVWLCILGAYLFTSILLWVFDRFSPYSYTNNRDKYKEDMEKREFTLRECLWFCMTSLTPQGGGEAPKNISGRLVAATWWLFGFIIIASYTANLAAFLTVSRLEQQINSLDDLSKQYQFTQGGSTETYFQRMAEIEEQFYNIWKQMSLNESMSTMERAKLAVWDYPVSDKYTNIWRFMQESKLPATAEEAINRVLNSKNGFAFIGDAMEIKYATLTNCKLQPVGQEFSRKPYAIAVQEGSRLRGEISSSILRLLNERKLESLKERWWHQNPKRQECPNSDEESTGISIQNIGGVFILILGGIIISLTMLEKKNVLNEQKDGIQMSDSMSGRSLPDTDISATTASINNGMIGLHRVNSPNGSIR